ncbi:MAG: H4MPT-linked C1 transfer pathway protein [Alphaproteobacteria bacterium GM202ARS2]|nr:H4MPT-linked C1 transfer pathway protein [Alphaproteobacteria bacterium GM202ARS2]
MTTPTPPCPPCLSWDIGGAHLKTALISDSTLHARQLPCPLWQGIDQFDRASKQALLWAESLYRQQPDTHHVTMSAELADIFISRKQGVLDVLHRLRALLPPQANILVYTLPDGLCPIERAQQHPLAVASANWHITARLMSRLHTVSAPLLLVDIGSTTTDITLLHKQTILSQSDNDHDRLRTGQLVYSGVVRTPLMAFGPTIDVDGKTLPLCAEVFATTADLYRLSDSLKAEDDQMPTADGKSKDASASRRRIARMVALDQSTPSPFLDSLIRAFTNKQKNQLVHACRRVLAQHQCDPRDTHLCVTGCGAFLMDALADALHPSLPRYRLSAHLAESYTLADHARVDSCAPAVALTLL